MLSITRLSRRLATQQLPRTHQPRCVIPCQSLRWSVLPTTSVRFNSSAETPPVPRSLPHKPAPHRNPEEPVYQLTFTCKVCRDRSSHTISKQGYHKGTILINCPGCKNRHLISDHLRIFADQSTTIQDIMAQQGEDVQRGSITPDGDVEFWAKDAKPHGPQ